MSPSTFPVRRLVDPTPEQREEVIRLVMKAFAEDPFPATVLGGKDTDPDIYYRFIAAHVLGALVDGELWVAEDLNASDGGKPKIVGVALWFPPGKQFLGTEEQRAAAGMDKVIADLGEEMSKWWADYFIPKNGQQAAASLGSPTARLEACHLLVLAVLPSYHNKGIGRSLMHTRAAQAFEQGQRVCWEAGNEPNVAKYTKWGGRALSRERYEGTEGRWFEMWIMEMRKPEIETTQ